MSSSTASNESTVQSLLRFLTQAARLPLPQALSLAKTLDAASLSSPSAIASTPLSKLASSLFGDEKLAKQLHAAAKREQNKGKKKATGKRKADVDGDAPALSKRSKGNEDEGPNINLPGICTNEEAMKATVLTANRAPLLLAFAVVLLRYTRPEQPLSSRLSLAQAVVSVNARGKAEMIGLKPERAQESDEGIGRGWRGVNIMGRDVAVLTRDSSAEQLQEETATESQNGDATDMREPALWGLDAEALEKSKGGAELPVHRPQAARAYLSRSFVKSSRSANDSDPAPVNGKRSKSAKQSESAAKDRNLSLLLGALDLLFASWSSTLSREELNSKAWTWYTRVRPQVEHGPGGWGNKGDIHLSDILAMRRRE